MTPDERESDASAEISAPAIRRDQGGRFAHLQWRPDQGGRSVFLDHGRDGRRMSLFRFLKNKEHDMLVHTVNDSISCEQYHDCKNTCLLYTSPSPRDRQKS